MTEVELGLGKRARAAYSFDDIAIAPSRRTRDPHDISVEWQIDAYRFAHPIIAGPVDSVVSPATAATIGRLGGLAVLNLEGLWARYADPEPVFAEIARLDPSSATRQLQRFYSRPVDPDLVVERIAQLRAAGIVVAGCLSPAGTVQLWRVVAAAGLDLFLIRGTTVSAEHVSSDGSPLNLKEFIYDLDMPVVVGGCATYRAALHLMRAGAAGVLVGFGGGSTHTTHQVLGVRVPMASAIADVAAARRDYLDESGGRYVHVIADGAMGTSGAIVKAIACGADAAMIASPLARADEAPGGGRHWGMEATHPELPRGGIADLGTVGSFAEILMGPSHVNNGTMNLVGALRRAMATCGYCDPKEFQRVEVVLTGPRRRG